MMNGLVMYAYFKGCDPIFNGELKKPDQLAPYLVLKIFREYPGMTGLFVSAVYSGTLRWVQTNLIYLLTQLMILGRKNQILNKGIKISIRVGYIDIQLHAYKFTQCQNLLPLIILAHFHPE